MKDFKCLIVHTPKLYRNKGKLESEINYCAMGLFSIAGELEKEGFETKILHLGIEKYLDKDFSIVDYIKENNIKFVAFSLHWHQTSYDVIETARAIKEDCPDIFISLGGYTSSFFAEEIMEKFPFIDAVIKGEGEIPIKQLAKAIYEDLPLGGIPNIYWRKDGVVLFNDNMYVATSEDLNNFEFFNPERMLHYNEYAKVPMRLEYSKPNQLTNTITEQGVCLGRGCYGNCAWCGGGYLSGKMLSGRHSLSYRNAENVIAEIKTLKEKYNFESFRFSFDSNPTDRSYLIDLFNKIAQAFNGDINAIYNIDGLPDKTFLNAFKKAFSGNSILQLSPVIKNEELRKKYKSFFFTNEQLEEVLKYMEEIGIKAELYFSDIPGVKKQENEVSKKYGEYLQNKYSSIKAVYNYPITIEPASPWTYNPQKYNLKYTPKNFIDYYNETKAVTKSFVSNAF